MKQRKIKFRAWDKEIKEMYTGFSFEDIYAGHDESYLYDENDKWWSQPDWDNAILMQFTGLKDKNGKEIYEGDILKYGQYILNPIIVYWDRGLCCWELKTEDEGNFEHLLDLSGEEDLGYIIWEIIGNIYENPELLEER